MAKQSFFPFIFVLLLSITPFIAVEVPRFLAFLPLIIGLGGSFVVLKSGKFTIPKTYSMCAGTLIALMFLSCIWSIAPKDVFIESVKTSAIIAFGTLWIGLCHSVNIRSLRPYLPLIPILFSGACMLVLIEVVFDMPLYRVVHGIPSEQRSIPSDMNRGIICLIMLYFLSLSFIQKHIIPKARLRYTLFGLITGSLLCTLFISESQSSQIAFIVGVVVFFGFPAKHKIAYVITAAVIAAIIALVPFIVDIFYDVFVGYGQKMPWFSDAYAGNRAEIWQFVTLYAMHNPLYGFGMEATRYVEHFEHAHIYHTESTVLHPHNFAVQIWIEYGAIGVLIFSALIYKVLIAIWKSNDASRRYITAAFAQTIMVSSVAYGMWQSWWVGHLLFILGIAILSNRSMMREP